MKVKVEAKERRGNSRGGSHIVNIPPSKSHPAE